MLHDQLSETSIPGGFFFFVAKKINLEPISKIIFCRFQRPLACTAIRTRRNIAHLPPHPSRGSAQRSSEIAGKLFLR
jgi:hypothetical protein